MVFHNGQRDKGTNPYITPRGLVIFLDKFNMWGFHCSNESINTPSYFTCFSSLSAFLFIFYRYMLFKRFIMGMKNDKVSFGNI